MFLHVGRDTIVRFDEIIGIFDIETATTSKITREYLNVSPQKEIVSVTQELPKSFIVCGCNSRSKRGGLNGKNFDKNNIKVYVSQISSATLKKRLESANSLGDPLFDNNTANDK